MQSNTSSLQFSLQNARNSNGELLFTIPVIFAFLMFVLIYFPCVAVVAAIKKESGTVKWALFEILFTTILAWIIAFITKTLLTWLL